MLPAAQTPFKPTLLNESPHSDSLSGAQKVVSDVKKWLDIDVVPLEGQSEDELLNRIAGLKTFLFKIDAYLLNSSGSPLIVAIQGINLTLCSQGSDLRIEHTGNNKGNAASTEVCVIKDQTFESWKQTIIEKESAARQEYWARYF